MIKDIDKYLEDKNQNEQYDYKILLYGNYTFRQNLEADSLVEVLRHTLPYMSKRWKIHFTLLIPELVGSLSPWTLSKNMKNVDVKIYQLPTYINQMRQHFNTFEFMNHVDWRHNDFDIVYSHLPEHTLQMANCLYNNSNITPKFIGYSHWFEVPENAPYGDRAGVHKDFPARALYESVAGLLMMDECGVNSNWLKQKTIENAAHHWNDKVLKRLDKIIQPHYLGVDRINVRKKYKDKTVVFNHRAAGYTGWEWFVKVMDEVWEQRQDFQVYTTLTQIDRPWNRKVVCDSRDDYMEFLSTMKFGVGTFQTYSAWSISTTDGFSVGVPYLLPNKLCYPEMTSVVKDPYPYLYHDRKDFISKFNSMLDNEINYDTTTLAKNMIWEERISKWFGGWKDVFKLDASRETEAVLKIRDFIKDKGIVTKRQITDYLGWGVRIKWSGYRNALRKYPEIKFTKYGYEWRK